MAHLVGQLGALDQGLARHAAVVQAVAAHLVGLDQGHFGFDSGRNVGRHQTRCTPANHNQVAVKSLGAHTGPTGIDLALLDGRHHTPRQQGENAQQHKAAQKRRAQNALHRIELRQLRARIHIHRGASQHAELAGHIKRAGFHARQAHEQVDQEKRHDRDQAQGEEIKRTLFVHTSVDVGQALSKSHLHPLAQHKARSQKSQGSADGGSERHQQQTLPQAKQRTARQGDDDRTRKRQGRSQHIHQKIHSCHRERLLRVQLRETSLTGFELFKAEETAQIKGDKSTHDQGQKNQKQGLTGSHDKDSEMSKKPVRHPNLMTLLLNYSP